MFSCKSVSAHLLKGNPQIDVDHLSGAATQEDVSSVPIAQAYDVAGHRVDRNTACSTEHLVWPSALSVEQRQTLSHVTILTSLIEKMQPTFYIVRKAAPKLWAKGLHSPEDLNTRMGMTTETANTTDTAHQMINLQAGGLHSCRIGNYHVRPLSNQSLH